MKDGKHAATSSGADGWWALGLLGATIYTAYRLFWWAVNLVVGAITSVVDLFLWMLVAVGATVIALLAAAALISVLELGLLKFSRVRRSRRSYAAATLPRRQTLGGLAAPTSPLDELLAGELEQHYQAAYGQELADVHGGQLAALRACLLPVIVGRPHVSAIIEQQVIAPAYGLLSSGDQALAAMLEQAGRVARPRPWRVLMACLYLMSRGRLGWGPGERVRKLDVAALHSEPQAFSAWARESWARVELLHARVQESLPESLRTEDTAVAPVRAPRPIGRAGSRQEKAPKAMPMLPPATTQEQPPLEEHRVTRQDSALPVELVEPETEADLAAEAKAGLLEVERMLEDDAPTPWRDPVGHLGRVLASLELVAAHHPDPGLVVEVARRVQVMEQRLQEFGSWWDRQLEQEGQWPALLEEAFVAAGDSRAATFLRDLKAHACRLYLHNEDPARVAVTSGSEATHEPDQAEAARQSVGDEVEEALAEVVPMPAIQGAGASPYEDLAGQFGF